MDLIGGILQFASLFFSPLEIVDRALEALVARFGGADAEFHRAGAIALVFEDAGLEFQFPSPGAGHNHLDGQHGFVGAKDLAKQTIIGLRSLSCLGIDGGADFEREFVALARGIGVDLSGGDDIVAKNHHRPVGWGDFAAFE